MGGFPFMKTRHKSSKPRSKPSTSGRPRKAKATHTKAAKNPRSAKRGRPPKTDARRRRRRRKQWSPRRRITEKEVAVWCRRVVRALERERRRCGVSLDDVSGPAGVTRQCLGKVNRRKGAPLLSTVLRYFYALNLDWCFVAFTRRDAETQGSARDGWGKHQLRFQAGRGCGTLRPCRNH